MRPTVKERTLLSDLGLVQCIWITAEAREIRLLYTEV